MASILKHIRSSSTNKRPTGAGLAEGQLAINTASGTPGLFFKDNAGIVVKVGPTHVGVAAPNASPVGSAGNSLGEMWVDNSTTTHGLKYYTGSTFYSLTPSGTATTVGMVRLATDAETQAGSASSQAVTPASLQSKISDSTSTTSSTTIASSTAVKSAYDLVSGALPKAGGRMTGALEIGPTGSLSFEGSSDDGFETTLAVVNPTTDNTITFPNITGTVVTSADTGSVTSAMILNGTILDADISASAAIALSKLATGLLPSGITVNSGNIVDLSIVNADINASAAIVDTKLATIATAGKVSNSATTAASANTASAIVARDGSGNFTAGTITAALTGAASSNVLKAGDTMTGVLTVTAGTAALPSIAVTSDPNTGVYSPGADQLAITAGGTGRLFVSTTAVSSSLPINHPLGAVGTPSITFSGDANTGLWSPGADILAASTAGSERLRIAADGKVGIGTTSAARLLDVAGDASFYGVRVGRGNSAIGTNTALGADTLGSNTTGADNVAVGNSALAVNTTGNSNTAVGVYALLSSTTGSFNTAVGQGALFSSLTGASNTATGIEALYFNTTGGSNVANGFRALKDNTTGSENIAIGYEALESNTVGNANVAIGLQALLASTTAINNTAVGLRALEFTTSGTTNTAVGKGAGATGAQANTTGSNNTFLGGEATGASATASNVITLGNGSIATLRCQVTTITSLSDARDKKEITDLRAGLDFVSKLRPVSFTWDSRDGGKVDIEDAGFLAQELLAVQEETGIVIPNLVSQENPDRLEAGYGTLLPVLVNAVQELTGIVKELQDEITTLKLPIN